jgi:hypothetical protein
VFYEVVFTYLTGGLIMDTVKSVFFSAVIFVKLIAVVFLMLFIVAGLAGTSLSADGPTGKLLKEQENPYAKAELTTRIIPSANNSFGYDILLDGKLLVHQTNIPGQKKGHRPWQTLW